MTNVDGSLKCEHALLGIVDTVWEGFHAIVMSSLRAFENSCGPRNKHTSPGSPKHKARKGILWKESKVCPEKLWMSLLG